VSASARSWTGCSCTQSGSSFCDLDGTQVTVETPLPEDLAMALQKLEDFDERRR
jgi:hypothetical protein